MRLGPYRALEHRFGFEVSDEHLSSWLRTAFEPLHTEPSKVEVTYSIRSVSSSRFDVAAGGAALSGPIPASRVLPLLLSNLNRAIARSARRHLVLHAGVVGSGGGAVLLPGSSGSGKSTMVATAGRLGHPYGADEHAAIGFEDGLIEPIPKPLALKPGSAHLFGDLSDGAQASFFGDQLFLPAAALCGGLITPSSPIVAIAFPAYEEGVTATLRGITPAEALLRLREHSWNFGVDPVRAFRILSAVVRKAPAYDLTFADSSAAWSVLMAHHT